MRNGLIVLAALWGLWSPVAELNALARQNPGENSQGARVQAEATESSTNNPDAAQNMPSGGGSSREPLVSVGHDVVLKAGDSAETVVVIFGSAKVDGKVSDAAVAIFGDLEVDGEVRDAAVAIMGNLKLGPHAKVHEAVSVGGRVDAAETAQIHGQPVSIDFPEWLRGWLKHCVLKLRPLAPQVAWVWVVAGIIFLLYMLIAAVFPRPVEACVNEMSRRPASTFLLGLLTKLLLPLIVSVLAITVLGLIVVPFLIPALILGVMVGKTALLELLGLKLGRAFAGEGFQNRLLALLIGGVIITALYLVPVLGLLIFAITSVWGLGAAVMAAFGGLRRELPPKPAAPVAGIPEMDLAGAGQGSGPVPGVGEAFAAPAEGGPGGPGTATATATATLPSAPLVMPDTLRYPRTGFWERMGSGFLDVILVSILGAVLGPMAPLTPFVALAYFAGMWAWKGTTIGGIVLGLKVVRYDGQAVGFAAALIRALAAAFSIFVLFLGFLWIIWDKEKQGWHDKIAGTVVLKLPKGTPLVMF
jgi:uncharacterized RDD family membrane protein YckC